MNFYHQVMIVIPVFAFMLYKVQQCVVLVALFQLRKIRNKKLAVPCSRQVQSRLGRANDKPHYGIILVFYRYLAMHYIRQNNNAISLLQAEGFVACFKYQLSLHAHTYFGKSVMAWLNYLIKDNRQGIRTFSGMSISVVTEPI